jgi:hypothetical protein
MLIFLIWLLISIVAATFIVETAFMTICTAKRMQKDGVLEEEMELVAKFWLIIGTPADIWFNWTRGSRIFHEFPRELTFSSRVQRHVDKKGKYYDKAVKWGRILNSGDPDHIHGVPPE